MTLKSLVDVLSENAKITVQGVGKEEMTLVNLTKFEVLSLKEETLTSQVYLAKLSGYDRCLIVIE